MRTTRVQSVPSSIFKNSRQYLHSNELFYRTMQENESRGRQQRGQQQEQANNRQSTSLDKKRKLKRTQNKFFVRGLHLDADTAATMRNSLLERAIKINAAYKRKARISIYRTSI